MIYSQLPRDEILLHSFTLFGLFDEIAYVWFNSVVYFHYLFQKLIGIIFLQFTGIFKPMVAIFLIHVLLEVFLVILTLYFFLIENLIDLLFWTFNFLYPTFIIKLFESANVKIQLVQISFSVVGCSFSKRISRFYCATLWPNLYLLLLIFQLKTVFLILKVILILINVHIYIWVLRRLRNVRIHLLQFLYVSQTYILYIWSFLFNL